MNEIGRIRCLSCGSLFGDPPVGWECTSCGGPVSQTMGVIHVAGRDPQPCWRCHGDGGWHDCGEDCCPCLYPEDRTSPDWITCPECGGTGEL